MAERDGRYLSWYNQMESQKQTGGLERSNSQENCLVGGLEHYVFLIHSVGNFIIPTDSYFSEG
jgi:hypothetical protein